MAIGGVAGSGIVVEVMRVEGICGEEKEEERSRSWEEALSGGKGVVGARAGVEGPEDAGDEG